MSPRGPIKGEVYADFVVELFSEGTLRRYAVGRGGKFQMGALCGWVLQSAGEWSWRDLGRAKRVVD